MENWAEWLAVFGLSVGGASLAFYLLARQRAEQTHNRILRLEREIALVRISEDDKERKLNEIFGAVTSLQRTTEERLVKLRERIDEFLANGGGLQ